MWVRLLVTAPFVVACGAVLKPPEPDRRLNIETTGSAFESDRGYQFAALPEPGAKVVQLDVRYPVGSADDPPGKQGLAHLVEHLLFDVEYATGETKTSIGAELGRTAVSWNAETHADYTTYSVLATPEALDAVIGLEVNRLAIGCGGLTPEIVARDREVVLNELRERQGASGAELQRLLHDEVYPAGHPYRPVASVETVAKLELHDVCEFLAGPYQRGKASVIASGAVTAASLQTAAGHHLGRLRKRVMVPRPVPPAVEPRGGTVRLRGDLDEPTLLATWPLPPMASRDYRMIEIGWRLMASRIDAFAFTYGWGHSASTTVIGGAHAPVLVASVVLASPAKLDDAIEAMQKSVEFAARSIYRGGDDRGTGSWRTLWEDRAEWLLARWESLPERNALFGDFLQFDVDSRFLIGRIDELDKATPGSTRDLVEHWLAPSRARYLMIEPSNTTGARGGRTYAGGAEEHGTQVDGALADRPMPLPSARLVLETVRYKLGNGLSVILWPHGQAPLVHGRLVIDSGSAHDPASKEGISSLVGADEVSSDSLVFTGRQLATRVDDLVEGLAIELRSPGYELDDEQQKYLRGRLQQQRAKERMAYEHDKWTALYGEGHPYTRTSLTEDSLDHIDRDSVMSWARGHIVAKNATLIIAGKFDPALVKKHIAYNADQVSSGSDSRDLDAQAHPQQKWVAGIAAKVSPTVEIDVHFIAGRGLDRDHAKRLVLEQVLANRLSQLRGKQALTYGFSVAYEPRRAGGLWTIAGEVDASRAIEAATALATILSEIRRDPESYRNDFVYARQHVVQRLLLTATDSSAITERLVELAQFDLPDDFYAGLASEVARLTLADLQPFVTTELASQGQVFGAFGNEDVTKAALAAAALVK
jgi:zinc protease